MSEVKSNLIKRIPREYKEKRQRGFYFLKDWLVESLDVQEKHSQMVIPVIALFFPWDNVLKHS